MKKELGILGGLTVGFVGYWLYGPRKKESYDNLQDYSNDLLIRRNKHAPLENKEKLFEKIGFSIWNHTGVQWTGLYSQSYFNDEASYQFDPMAIKQIAEASYELHNLCLEAVDNVVKSDELMDLFEIPENMREAIKDSWNKNHTDLLGRFDLLYDGQSNPKLIEYNADTPTLLLETARAQAVWAKPKNLLQHQFNFIINALDFAWNQLIKEKADLVLVADKSHAEEWDQIMMIADTAKGTGYINTFIHDIEDLKYNENERSLQVSFLNITWLYKLYPWEWILLEQSGRYFDYLTEKQTRFFEPPWKMILSNKSLLPYLWQLYPNHPNLLPAFFTDDPFYDEFLNDYENKKKSWVAKPKYGRGGEHILVSNTYNDFDSFITAAKEDPKYEFEELGTVSLGKRILQAFYPTPHFNGRRITVGSWIVYGAPAGICVREDIKDVVYDNSCFVPHYAAPINQSTEFKTLNLDFVPSTKFHKQLRDKLYGKAGEDLLKTLYSKKNEYIEINLEEQSDQTKYTGRTHGGGGGGYYGGYYGNRTADAVAKNRETFTQKVQRAAQNVKQRMSMSPQRGRISSGRVGRGMGSAS